MTRADLIAADLIAGADALTGFCRAWRRVVA